jgi:hypothetical protein
MNRIAALFVVFTAICISPLVAAEDPIQYRVLATKQTSTMEQELNQAGEQSFQIVGMTVGRTAMGGFELVSILRRKLR